MSEAVIVMVQFMWTSSKSFFFQGAPRCPPLPYLRVAVMTQPLNCTRANWYEELPWLKLAPSHILQQSVKNLGNAYMGFFSKRADFPKFKCKGRHKESFRYPDPK